MNNREQKKQYTTDIEYYNVYASYKLELLAKKIKDKKYSKYNFKLLNTIAHSI